MRSLRRFKRERARKNMTAEQRYNEKRKRRARREGWKLKECAE